MTTLPTTTRVQLPRSAGNGALAAPASGGPMAAAAVGMTAGDVWRVLRGHLWLIVLSVVLGGVIGFFVNMYLAKNYSRYTAVGLVQIADQRVGRITDQGGEEFRLDTSTLTVEQRSQAAYLKTDALLNAVVNRPAVRETAWFKQFVHTGPGGNEVADIPAAKLDLADKLTVQPIVESKYVQLEFSYSVPADCATIVKELVDQALEEQGDVKSTSLRARMQDLNLTKSTLTLKKNRLQDDIAKLQLELNSQGISTNAGMQSSRSMEMSGYQAERNEAQRDYNQANANLKQIQAQLDRGEDPPEIEKQIREDNRLQGLREQVDGLQAALGQVTVGPNNPRYQQIQQQLVSVQKQSADAEAEKRRVKPRRVERRTRSEEECRPGFGGCDQPENQRE